MSKQLYEQDLQLWIEKTIGQLKNHEFESLDIEHIIEELVDLGKSQKNALKSNLKILLAHLLKLRVQSDAPDTMKGSWYSSVLEHRQRVLDNLADTPSLKGFLLEAVEKAYVDGRKLAIKEGKLANFGVEIPQESEYPLICPFSIEQILDEDFYGGLHTVRGLF
ncbi:MAG: DUF29 domain-containing protein [Crocosphaera sp.]|jgi:hypothetical protein